MRNTSCLTGAHKPKVAANWRNGLVPDFARGGFQLGVARILEMILGVKRVPYYTETNSRLSLSFIVNVTDASVAVL